MQQATYNIMLAFLGEIHKGKTLWLSKGILMGIKSTKPLVIWIKYDSGHGIAEDEWTYLPDLLGQDKPMFGEPPPD